MLKITVLGCGASGGVPLLKYGWGACDPNNPKNLRTRSSIVIESRQTRLLVDMGPDVRQQLLRHNIDKIDGVFFSHGHYDHSAGINELRPVYFGTNQSLQIYGKDHVIKNLERMFFYLFEESNNDLYKPYVEAHIVGDEFSIGDISGICFEQNHGYGKSTGLRIADFAYTTDVVDFEDSFEKLRGIDTWIVGCLSKEKKPTHANLDTVLEWVEKINPKRTYLTHMNIDLDYDSLLKELPPNVWPAYDGLHIEVDS